MQQALTKISDGRSVALTFLAVLMAHAFAAAWLVTQTTEYTPLNLVTPQESATLQASVVEYSEPPPQAVEQPPVLTADRGQRVVEQVTEPTPEPPPVPAEVKPVVPPPAPKPVMIKKPLPKPRVPKPVAKPQMPPPEAHTGSATSSSASESTLAGARAGRMMQNNSSAQPKNVDSIGCAVPEPDYPRRAQRLKQEGEVLVKLVINPQGQLTRYEIARSSGVDALDQAALAAVQKIRCTPYLQDGQPITVMTLQPVNFRLAH